MSKLHFAIVAGLAGTMAANAGQIIQIGGASGITSSYITSQGGNLGGWGERSYVTALFNNSTITSPVTPGDPASHSVNVPTTLATPAPGSIMVDNNNGGVTFDLLSDGNDGNGRANNFFASINGAGTITIPINLARIDKVWLMLNDYWGYARGQEIISFNFSSRNATDLSPDLVDTLTLTNSATGLRSSVDCTGTVGVGYSLPCTTASGAG